jgi:hypothetical protein
MLWTAGLVLQALLILAPILLARHLVANSAELLRVGAERDARWRAGELTDSLALAQQREDARAARAYSIAPNGDTLFALVHVPSGRPDPAAVAALGRQAHLNARYLTTVILGLMPTILVLVTLMWIIVRRKDVGPAQTLGAP